MWPARTCTCAKAFSMSRVAAYRRAREAPDRESRLAVYPASRGNFSILQPLISANDRIGDPLVTTRLRLHLRCNDSPAKVAGTRDTRISIVSSAPISVWRNWEKRPSAVPLATTTRRAPRNCRRNPLIPLSEDPKNRDLTEIQS